MRAVNSAFHPSGVGKWVPASAGKAKAGMVHSVSGWTWGVQVTLWDPLRTRAIPECLTGVFTTRRYRNSRLPYLTLPALLEYYIRPILQNYRKYPSRIHLRSARTHRYEPLTTRLKFGKRRFSYAGPTAWNSLSHVIQVITNFNIFEHKLKTFFVGTRVLYTVIVSCRWSR